MIQSLNVLADVLGCELSDLKQHAEWVKNKETRHKCYYSYRKTKPNGKFRVIAPSCYGLRNIQNRLMSRVFNHVKFPYYITGSVKHRSGAINAKMHCGNPFHLQTDLTSFFDFVGYREVYKALIALRFSADVARLITQLTTYNGHLPQGTPTSPFLANLVGLSIDKIFLEYCEPNGIIYTRYVDDITLSSKNDFQNEVPELLQGLIEAGYLYSNKKTLYKAGSIQVTGAKTGSKGVSATEKQMDKVLSNSTSEQSKKGIFGYMRYLDRINANFKIEKVRETFAVLQFPNKLYPRFLAKQFGVR